MSYNSLYRKEADMLAKIVSTNFFIRVLDLGHNCLGDRGLDILSRSLVTQTEKGFGVNVLSLVNTNISESAGNILANILVWALESY